MPGDGQVEKLKSKGHRALALRIGKAALRNLRSASPKAKLFSFQSSLIVYINT